MQNFHVGLPCLKLSLSPSNQKHHGKAARTCSVKDAWSEMNDDRRGRDKTIDHSLTEERFKPRLTKSMRFEPTMVSERCESIQFLQLS